MRSLSWSKGKKSRTTTIVAIARSYGGNVDDRLQCRRRVAAKNGSVALSGVRRGCGTVEASGNYTAPRALPSSASTTLMAQSVADPAIQISAAVAITSETDRSIVGSEPAATKEKSGTERGKKDWPTIAARLLRSIPQSFMQGRAARGGAQVAIRLGDGWKSFRGEAALFCEKSYETRIWLVRRKTAD